MTEEPYAPLDPIPTGGRGRCPRCGEGAIFQGLLSVVPRCPACGLDLSWADSADGPAVFVILILGFLVAGSALVVELAYAPPAWLHAVLWAPLVLILSVILMRLIKGIFIALQYVQTRRDPEA